MTNPRILEASQLLNRVICEACGSQPWNAEKRTQWMADWTAFQRRCADDLFATTSRTGWYPALEDALDALVDAASRTRRDNGEKLRRTRETIRTMFWEAVKE